MDWHWTWQDPVALGLAVAILGALWWLRRRRIRREQDAKRVPVEALSLSRRRPPGDDR